MTRSRYGVNFGCHEGLDLVNDIRDDSQLDERMLARSLSSIVEPEGEE
jgi:hypothetical protein